MQFTMSFIIAVIGALIYGFAGKAKAAELGRIIFFSASCGSSTRSRTDGSVSVVR